MNTTTPPPTPETDAIILPRNRACLTQYEWREHGRRLERERNEARDQLKAMREVIEDVNKILLSIQRNDIFEETMRKHATCALTKLKPFILL